MIILALLILLAIVCGYGWLAYRIKTTVPHDGEVTVSFVRDTDTGDLVSKQGHRLAYGRVPGCWRVKPEDFPA